MDQPPPPLPAQTAPNRDADHLGILSVFHFVAAGLAVFGLGFLALHFTIMNTVLSSPQMMNDHPDKTQVIEFFAVFRWFYAFMALMFLIGLVGNLCSGLFLRRRVRRTFSIVVAGLNCLCMPIGTILGVFTIMVLMRDSVRRAYQS